MVVEEEASACVSIPEIVAAEQLCYINGPSQTPDTPELIFSWLHAFALSTLL
jgi:hypothetical protein